jgi:putative spermidine/putrescine transport system ATP-binding protein
MTTEQSPSSQQDAAPIVAGAEPRGHVTVTFEGVERRYGELAALDGLDFEIQPGELVALLGPSGCGKTTALRILGGFDRPTAGRVLLAGRDVTDIPAHKRDMGMVFQAYSLFPNMSVLDNVAFGLRMRRQSKARRSARARELLEIVGLGETGDRFPHQISGGQQQRVALARALAIEPTVLLLDEPLSALDAQVRAQLRGEIRSLQLRLGITTLFVTHDQSEALSIADRVGVMQSGRLEQIDTPENVYRKPATEFVADFVGAMNRLPGRVGEGGEVVVMGQRLRIANPGEHAPGSDVEVLVRPEVIAVVADVAGAAQIVERTFLGSTVRLGAEFDGGNKVVVEAPAHSGEHSLGTRVSLRVAAEAVTVAAKR